MTPKEEFEYALKTLRTLMGRGMPEPRWFTEFDGSFHHVDTTVNTAVVGDHSQMAPAAVLDLLTMHALRWAWDTPKPPSRVCTRASECRNVPWIPTLEYIIEATAHLEA